MCESMSLVYSIIPFCLLHLASGTSFHIVKMEKAKIHYSCVTPIDTISSSMIHHCISKCSSTEASNGSTSAGSAGSNTCNALDYSSVSGSCVLFHVNYTSFCREITANSTVDLKELFVSKMVLWFYGDNGKYFWPNY